MTKTRLMLVVACAVSLAAVVPAASAEDLTLVFKTTSKDGASTSTSYYSTEKMRTGDAEHETIVEYGPGKITSIDKTVKPATSAEDMVAKLGELKVEPRR